MEHITCNELSPDHQQQLLAIARQSIEQGLFTHRPFHVELRDMPAELRNTGCCFVTLHLNGELRGCIGSLSAYQALAKDVAEHAYAAAYRDQRFAPVLAHEIPRLVISVSVLGDPTPIQCSSEENLLSQLRPAIDGLILEEHDHQNYLQHKATFLPSVWEHLPEPKEFVNALKEKAGLAKDYWSDTISWQRYSTTSFSEPIEIRL